jgi:hypothetical protein
MQPITCPFCDAQIPRKNIKTFAVQVPGDLGDLEPKTAARCPNCRLWLPLEPPENTSAELPGEEAN